MVMLLKRLFVPAISMASTLVGSMITLGSSLTTDFTSRLTLGRLAMSRLENSLVAPISAARSRVPSTTTSVMPEPASATSTTVGWPSTVFTPSSTPSSKPSFDALTLKGPPTRRPETWKRPSAFVVTVRVAPVGSCSTLTVAPSRGAPSAPSTRPAIVAEISCAWAPLKPSSAEATSAASASARNADVVESLAMIFPEGF